jgi:acyl-CoA synthetase (AMP-forming)/AMP-acid ligase II
MVARGNFEGTELLPSRGHVRRGSIVHSLRESDYFSTPLLHAEASKTSGSTGKPKGVVHTTAGYLLGAAMTVKYVFDVHPDDKFACMADVGWITGHT